MPSVLQQDSVRRQLDLVLSSTAFRSSTSLRRLLEYLTERTLHGEAGDLKEYRIGVEALGRPNSYDPRTDPSVRVQVGRLRSRLAEYYQEEGSGDRIVISVPKGGFCVAFEERPVAEPIVEAAGNVPAPSRPDRSKPIIFGALAVLLITAVLVSLTGTQSPAATDETKVVQEFWRPYLNSKLPILISLGVPMWMHVEIKGDGETPFVGELRDASLNEWPTEADSEEAKRLEAWRKRLQADTMEPRFTYVAVGEAMGAATMSKALGRYSNPTLVRSNLLSWDNIKGANVIFVGAPKFTPHFRNTPFIRNFRIGNFQVHNLQPKPGEKAAYPDVPQSTDRRGAALLGRYRNPGGGWITMIGSANSMCTWAATEYATKPDYLGKLVAALRQSFGKIPDSFEVVIEASFDQSSPVEIHHTVLRELE